jgi:hypothetical protein
LEQKLNSGIKSASKSQHVWYARWLLKHISDIKRDREEIEAHLAILCKELVSGKRALPPDALWPRDWFDKLLSKPKKSESRTIGKNSPQLIDRLTRLSEGGLKKLAYHKYITADLLPPLNADKFPKV